ncbi:uncharacterized protein METZ01_LOCUS124879 [marine metagenome]|uniref:Uncharacterized protein n=1 Tax=marine metagenome TaxID=408172 RepID=A0A381Y4Y5_9ZZZZ
MSIFLLLLNKFSADLLGKVMLVQREFNQHKKSNRNYIDINKYFKSR